MGPQPRLFCQAQGRPKWASWPCFLTLYSLQCWAIQEDGAAVRQGCRGNESWASPIYLPWAWLITRWLALGVQGCQDWTSLSWHPWVEPGPEVTGCGALRGSRASIDPLMGRARFGVAGCGLGVLELVDEGRFWGQCWPTGGWGWIPGMLAEGPKISWSWCVHPLVGRV